MRSLRRSRPAAGTSATQWGEGELERQREVDSLFSSSAGRWRAVYEGTDLAALAYQRRRDLVLEWVDGLRDPPGTRTLDVGCGAGVLSVAFANRGYRVEAVDHSEAMVALARDAIAEAGVSERVAFAIADAHAMPWADATFSVLTALGVLPWLHSPGVAVREMARVLEPGGHLVVTADNKLRLSHLLDPLQNPALQPLRRAVSSRLRRRRREHEWWERRHTPSEVDHMLVDAGLVVLRAATVGFTDFTFWRRPLVRGGRARSLHVRLQRLADRGTPVLRLLGSHYVVLAAKLAP